MELQVEQMEIQEGPHLLVVTFQQTAVAVGRELGLMVLGLLEAIPLHF